MLVALRQRDPAETGVLVHALGELIVRQRVVPLDLDLETYGHQPLSGLHRFEVRIRPPGGPPLDTVGPRDLFAPGEFFELSDDEKLTRPNFESFASGRRVVPPGTKAGATRKAALAYKTVQLRPQAEPKDLGQQALTGGALSVLTAGGAAARAALRTTGETGFRGPPREGIALREPQYLVAGAETLAAAGDPTTYTEAAQARAQLNAAAPGGRADVQVVGAHEVEA